MLTEMPLPLGQFERERYVRVDRCERLGEGRIRFPAFQEFDNAGLHAFCKSGRIFPERFVDVVERAEFFYQFRRRFFTNALDAGDIVRGVAAQRLVIDDTLRPESVSLAHPVLVVEDGVGKAFAQREYMHAGTDELEGVHVACRNDGLDVRTRREVAHNGPDDIVGLEARVLVDGNADPLEYLGCDLPARTDIE